MQEHSKLFHQTTSSQSPQHLNVEDFQIIHGSSQFNSSQLHFHHPYSVFISYFLLKLYVVVWSLRGGVGAWGGQTPHLEYVGVNRRLGWSNENVRIPLQQISAWDKRGLGVSRLLTYKRHGNCTIQSGRGSALTCWSRVFNLGKLLYHAEQPAQYSPAVGQLSRVGPRSPILVRKKRRARAGEDRNCRCLLVTGLSWYLSPTRLENYVHEDEYIDDKTTGFLHKCIAVSNTKPDYNHPITFYLLIDDNEIIS